MKPSLCQQCIIYPSCTRSCIPHAHESHALHHEIQKMKRFIFANSGRRKKHIKERHRRHYNILVVKFNRNREEGERVRLRHNRKHNGGNELFEGSFSGQMLYGADKIAWEIDKMILDTLIVKFDGVPVGVSTTEIS